MIKDKIKEIRKSRGLTQRALGEKIGVVESTIRAYETGRNKIKNDMVEKLAVALDVDVSELYTDEEYIKEGKIADSTLIELLKQLVKLGAIEDAENIDATTMDFINQEVKKEIIRIKNEEGAN